MLYIEKKIRERALAILRKYRPGTNSSQEDQAHCFRPPNMTREEYEASCLLGPSDPSKMSSSWQRTCDNAPPFKFEDLDTAGELVDHVKSHGGNAKLVNCERDDVLATVEFDDELRDSDKNKYVSLYLAQAGITLGLTVKEFMRPVNRQRLASRRALIQRARL